MKININKFYFLRLLLWNIIAATSSTKDSIAIFYDFDKRAKEQKRGEKYFCVVCGSDSSENMCGINKLYNMG